MTVASIAPPRTPVLRSASFEDPTLQSEAMVGWKLRYVQMSSGRFTGTSRQLCLPGVHLLRESNSTWLNQFGIPCPGRVVFGCTLGTRTDMTINGRSLSADSIRILNGDGEINALHPPMDVVVVAVDRALLHDHVCREQPSAGLGGTGRQVTSVTDTRLARYFGGQLLDMLSTCWDDVAVPGVLDAAREDLLGLVAPLLDAACPPPKAPLSAFSRAELVRRARCHLLDHIDQPLQVGQLCQALRVSRRALQLAFQEELGTTPSAYLRLLRLNGARRDLLAAEAGTSVQAVIARWGFWHFSRFSADYRRMYGELPSATLADRRSRPHSRLSTTEMH